MGDAFPWNVVRGRRAYAYVIYGSLILGYLAYCVYISYKAYYDPPTVTISYQAQGKFTVPQVSICWSSSILGNVQDGTFSASNPVAVQCDSPDNTKSRLQDLGYTASVQGGDLFGDSPQTVSASFIVNPNSTCEITQDLDADLYYKSCEDVEDCSKSDQCLTFDTTFEFDIVNPAATTRPSPKAGIQVQFAPKTLKPPGNLTATPYTINALGLTFHYSKDSDAIGSSTVLVPANAFNKVTLLVVQYEHADGTTTIRFEPLVTSSALVDLTENGLNSRAQSVVGGFNNNSLTYVSFSLDPRGIEMIEEIAAFSFSTLLSQYGGLWSYVALVFGIIYVSKEAEVVDVNGAIEKILIFVFHRTNNSVKSIAVKKHSRIGQVTRKLAAIRAIVDGQELLYEPDAPASLPGNIATSKAENGSSGPRADSTLEAIRAKLQEH